MCTCVSGLRHLRSAHHSLAPVWNSLHYSPPQSRKAAFATAALMSGRKWGGYDGMLRLQGRQTQAQGAEGEGNSVNANHSRAVEYFIYECKAKAASPWWLHPRASPFIIICLHWHLYPIFHVLLYGHSRRGLFARPLTVCIHSIMRTSSFAA